MADATGSLRGARPPRRTPDRLRLATAVAAAALTLASALAGPLLKRLPDLRPIHVVLLVFFGVLGIAVLMQLSLHWRSLRTVEDKEHFIEILVFGLFLYVVMVAGMFARYFWELWSSGKNLTQASVTALLLPLLVSPMVFYPLWSLLAGAPRSVFAVVAAFQNGFFWQTIFEGLKPFTPSDAG